MSEIDQLWQKAQEEIAAGQTVTLSQFLSAPIEHATAPAQWLAALTQYHKTQPQ